LDIFLYFRFPKKLFLKNIKEKGLRYASAVKLHNKQTVSFIFVHLLTPYYPPLVVSYCFLFSKKEEENEKAIFFIQKRKSNLSFCSPFFAFFAFFAFKESKESKPREATHGFKESKREKIKEPIFACFYYLGSVG
jgi:hypothetical protein